MCFELMMNPKLGDLVVVKMVWVADLPLAQHAQAIEQAIETFPFLLLNPLFGGCCHSCFFCPLCFCLFP